MLLHSKSEPVHIEVGISSTAPPELYFSPRHVVGRSTVMAEVYAQLRQLLRGDIPVLITGETGVGKEHVAETLYASSARREGPFVAVNCAAIPSELLEAELFGIESGVATGVTARKGKFQLARGGFLFLDEIGDMSLELQAKLLRALQQLDDFDVSGDLDLDTAVADLERKMIAAALARTKGKRSKAAKLLVISRNGLALKVDRLGLD